MRNIISALVIACMCIAIGTATEINDLVVNTHIIVPTDIGGAPHYDFTKNVVGSGWNGYSSHVGASLDNLDTVSQFKTLDCIPGAAPESKTYDFERLNSAKGGNPADPEMYSLVKSDITVGAATIPSIIPTDRTTIDPNARYDTFQEQTHAYFDGGWSMVNWGTTAAPNNVQLLDNRGIDTIIVSNQDDYWDALTGNNMGFNNPMGLYGASWSEVTIPGMPGTSESQAFRKANLAVTNSWALNTYDWHNTEDLEYLLHPIAFNEGK